MREVKLLKEHMNLPNMLIVNNLENLVNHILSIRSKLQVFLPDLEMDPHTVAAGFLHDVVEDTEVTLQDIKGSL